MSKKKTKVKQRKERRLAKQFRTEKQESLAQRNECRLPPLTAKTDKQKEYIRSIIESDQVISMGSAGTGKTFIAAYFAAQYLLRGDVTSIILTRPMVSVGQTAGLFPGTEEEKLDPWFRPVTDALKKFLGHGHYEYLLQKKVIKLASFETMQGSSFEDSFIILDEASNTTPFELKMFLTRVGEGCKVIVNGDVAQSSLKQESGLAQVIKMIKMYQMPIPVVEFTMDDCIRSGHTRMWLYAFDKYENGKPAERLTP